MKINARRVGNTLRPIVGFFLTVMGGFVAALNLATMFPSETYEASWGKVAFATALAVFGGFLNKSNATAHVRAVASNVEQIVGLSESKRGKA